MKRLDYNSKLAIITGASSGIGKSIAFRLIKKYGCTVYAIARNEEKLQKCKSELGNLAENYIVYPMDVSKKDGWQELFCEINDFFSLAVIHGRNVWISYFHRNTERIYVFYVFQYTLV